MEHTGGNIVQVSVGVQMEAYVQVSVGIQMEAYDDQATYFAFSVWRNQAGIGATCEVQLVRLDRGTIGKVRQRYNW